MKRHKVFIKAQESVGVKIVYGQFKKRAKKCGICHQTYETYEEKQTDVNNAIHLFKLAIDNRYEKAFIVSGDSDLIPSILAIKESFPEKKLGVIIPIRGRAFQLKSICDFHIQMKEKHLRENQFPDRIILPDNSCITRPESWR